VRRHPVEDHADPGLVEPVDEVAQVVGVAEARGRREVRRHLVAPRAAERVLHHRQQLDVGEPHVLDVGDELVGEIAEGAPAPPGSEVHLVDRHRLVGDVALGAGGDPGVVLPVVRRLEHDTAGRRGLLGAGGHRVGLLPPLAVGAEDDVLVARACAHAG
jgi:hypothetical protein